jgi:hypothetical protein
MVMMLMIMVMVSIMNSPDSASEHYQADNQDQHTRNHTNIGMYRLNRNTPGKQSCYHCQQYDTEGMGKGNRKAKEYCVPVPSPFTGKIGRNHGLAMPGLEGMRHSQSK